MVDATTNASSAQSRLIASRARGPPAGMLLLYSGSAGAMCVGDAGCASKLDAALPCERIGASDIGIWAAVSSGDVFVGVGTSAAGERSLLSG